MKHELYPLLFWQIRRWGNKRKLRGRKKFFRITQAVSQSLLEWLSDALGERKAMGRKVTWLIRKLYLSQTSILVNLVE